MKKHTHNQTSIITLLIVGFLFLFSCDSDDDPVTPDLDSVGFDINVSGSVSRKMEGTNASYKFLRVPSGFSTSHQLAVYLTDEEGYTVLFIILLNGTTLPGTGNYKINDHLSGPLKENDGSLIFGRNGVISHGTPGAGGGNIIITGSGSDFIKGTIDGSLRGASSGSGDINIKRRFYARLDE